MDEIGEELEKERQKKEEKIDKAFDSMNAYIDENGFIKNKDFTQIFDASNIHLLNLLMEDTTAFAVLLLMSRMMERNSTIKIRIKDMAGILNKSESTIKRAVATLKQKNYMTTIKDGREIVYFINPMVASRTAATNKTNSLIEYRERATTLKLGDSKKGIEEQKYFEFLKKEKQVFRFESKKKYEKPDVDEHVKKLYAAEKMLEVDVTKEASKQNVSMTEEETETGFMEGFGGFDD